MAKTPLGTALTAAHGRALTNLKAATLRDLLKLYPVWKLDDPASFARLVAMVGLLVEARRANASALAAAYYLVFRKAEGIAGTATPILAVPLAAEAIEIMANATAKAGVGNALRAGMTAGAALANGFVRLSGGVAREVLNGSRETIVESTRADSGFQGWIRVSDGDPCAFCGMLLGRGPVYSEESADFESHDHCACGAEPFADGSQWPGKNRELHDLWQQTKHSGDTTPLNAFRRSLNGDTTEE